MTGRISLVVLAASCVIIPDRSGPPLDPRTPPLGDADADADADSDADTDTDTVGPTGDTGTEVQNLFEIEQSTGALGIDESGLIDWVYFPYVYVSAFGLRLDDGDTTCDFVVEPGFLAFDTALVEARSFAVIHLDVVGGAVLDNPCPWSDAVVIDEIERQWGAGVDVGFASGETYPQLDVWVAPDLGEPTLLLGAGEGWPVNGAGWVLLGYTWPDGATGLERGVYFW